MSIFFKLQIIDTLLLTPQMYVCCRFTHTQKKTQTSSTEWKQRQQLLKGRNARVTFLRQRARAWREHCDTQWNISKVKRFEKSFSHVLPRCDFYYFYNLNFIQLRILSMFLHHYIELYRWHSVLFSLFVANDKTELLFWLN